MFNNITSDEQFVYLHPNLLTNIINNKVSGLAQWFLIALAGYANNYNIVDLSSRVKKEIKAKLEISDRVFQSRIKVLRDKNIIKRIEKDSYIIDPLFVMSHLACEEGEEYETVQRLKEMFDAY